MDREERGKAMKEGGRRGREDQEIMDTLLKNFLLHTHTLLKAVPSKQCTTSSVPILAT